MIQGVDYNDHNHCHKAGDIDREGNILRIFKALNFDFSDGEGEDESYHLWHHLVAIKNSQGVISTGGFANVYKISGDNFGGLKLV